MDKIKITTKGGLTSGATEESKEVVKKLYHALKCDKVFYNFQRSFMPLTGLDRDGKYAADTHTFFAGQTLEIGDIKYFPVPKCMGHDTVVAGKLPKTIKEIFYIFRMLRMSHENDGGMSYGSPIRYMNKDEVAEHYAKYVLANRRGRKLPSSIVFENIFGIFGLLLFTALFFLFVASISKAIAIGAGLMLAFFGAIALHGIWAEG